MSFVLDTNICSAHLRRPSGLMHRFVQHSGRLAIPTIVLAELYAMAFLREDPYPLLARIAEFLRDVEVLPFDEACARKFGELRGQLRRKGIAVNPVDLLIAAVALVHDRILVTNNTADFQFVPNLQLADWLTT